MAGRSLGRFLVAIRDGVSLGIEFGPHALGSMVSLAETVEVSVYEPASLTRETDGLRFALLNPPLRVGAFSSVRVRVNDTPLDPGAVRLRSGAAGEWREGASISADAPFELRPGERTEIALRLRPPRAKSKVRIRLDLENVAIPPTVWFEFQDTARSLRPR